MPTCWGASTPIFATPPFAAITVTTMLLPITTCSPGFLLSTSMALLHEWENETTI
jgi:hypothetical protein